MKWLALVACMFGCSGRVVTLAELPKLRLSVLAYDRQWARFDPLGPPRAAVSVYFFVDERDCPSLDPSLTVTANGVALDEIKLGGEDDTGYCEAPFAMTEILRTPELGPALDVVIADASTTITMQFTDLLSTSTVSVIDPIGALAPAAKVRMQWGPEDLTTTRADSIEATFAQLAEPFEHHTLNDGNALVEANEIRLSVPEEVSWSGPTQLILQGIQLPYVTVDCVGALSCGGSRDAAAETVVEIN
ncbi:MAG TPA: hypothetical protein VIV11_19750 [Kofleriaceae bacterium]